MRKALFFCCVALTLVFGAQAQAQNCCQCWNDPPDGGAFTCSDVANEAECVDAGAAGGWTHCIFVDECWCEEDVCGGPHKMHFPQWPDNTGWDVNATAPVVLADDWQCSETGRVRDIHFWGSWRDDDPGTITSFNLSIHADIPADPPTVPYSRPGDELWSYEATYFSSDEALLDSDLDFEGWYDPMMGVILPAEHRKYYQYHVYLPPHKYFDQQADTIYWLNISANVAEPEKAWGWKSSKVHWNDDAVWGLGPDPTVWIEMYEPVAPNFDSFTVTFDNTGMFVEGLGSDPDFPNWYEYAEWWNVWFYDHPLDPERFKVVHIEFDVAPTVPGPPIVLEVAVNWSTDSWDVPGEPPLPGVPEELYIGREILLSELVDLVPGHYALDWVWRDYNPEWVSVDVRGSNFVITNGTIMHDCVQQSLDQAFVITNALRPIPAVSEWGLLVMALLGLTAGTIMYRKFRAAAA